MPGSTTNTSFIPKHTPNKFERKNSPRQLFIGTILVRVLFVAVIIAAVGVFFYERNLSGQLTAEVHKIQAIDANFIADEEKVKDVTSMDLRLLQANDILTSGVSIASLFTAIEKSVIGTVQLLSVEITQETKDEIILAASVKTDSFDSTIFQRRILAESSVLQNAEISEVNISGINETVTKDSDVPTVSFEVSILINPKDIIALETINNNFPPPASIPTALPVEDVSSEQTESISTEGDGSVEVGFGNL